MLVEPDDLKVGNARLSFGFITLNQLAGVPIGAVLFAVGSAVPFVTQAIALGLGAILISRIITGAPARAKGSATVRGEIAEGLQWVRNHDAVRTLTLTIIAFNITFGAVWSILVLYASERLGLGEVGFGLLITASAVGGILGTVAYVAVESRIGMANILRIGLIIETLTHLGLAITRSPVVALAILFVFGVHEAMWGTTAGTIRQRVVPTELQGRVSSVYMMGLRGSLVVGSALGGVIAKVFGLTGPFWFGFVGSALILTWIWKRLAAVALAEA
jgi:predicted MFS family arabinose efflux permease